jgi:tripartite ATP-independent transporter DctP family solute receptor
MSLFLKSLACAALAGLALGSTAYAVDFPARLGSLDPTTTAKHRGLVKAAEIIKQKTDGRVVITIFPSSQLGNAREMTEAVQLGSLDAIIMPASFLGGFNPAIPIFDIPYVFPSDREVSRKLREGPFGEAALETFRKRGFEPVALWSGGTKVFSSNKSLAGVQDFAGQRFRVMDSNILIKQFAALKASAIVLPFGELYTALQNGVIDAQENPIDIIERMKFFEVQKNVLVTDHGAIIEVILFSPSFWKRLSENDRKVVRAAFREVAGEVAKGKEDDAAKSLEFLRKAGLNVRIASEAERAKLRELIYPPARDVYFGASGDEGRTLIKLYEDQLKVVGK